MASPSQKPSSSELAQKSEQAKALARARILNAETWAKNPSVPVALREKAKQMAIGQRKVLAAFEAADKLLPKKA